MNNKVLKYKSKAKSPINIALIKYWGKDSEELITPLNNSISLTLDTKTFYTETTIEIYQLPQYQNEIISLSINNKEIAPNSRIISVINKFKSIAKEKLSNNSYHFNIISYNTFPTASGCASSASSMSCLVCCLDSALQTNLTKEQLSAIARIGSGSACRSVIGGIVEWKKDGGDSSHALQLYSSDYWKLNVMLIIVSNEKKEISSSLGMKLSKETSQFLQYRINTIVPYHIQRIKKAFEEKNFEDLGNIIMRDSNNFHAVCRDTFPPIFYLNQQSEYIIKCVNVINRINRGVICAYTFDAGANGFIIYEYKNKEIIKNFFKEALHSDSSDNEDILILIKGRPNKDLFIKENFFELGEGPEIL